MTYIVYALNATRHDALSDHLVAHTQKMTRQDGRSCEIIISRLNWRIQPPLWAPPCDWQLWRTCDFGQGPRLLGFHSFYNLSAPPQELRRVLSQYVRTVCCSYSNVQECSLSNLQYQFLHTVVSGLVLHSSGYCLKNIEMECRLHQKEPKELCRRVSFPLFGHR